MSLERDISALPGVASATVERNGSAIIGVRVEMEEDADGQVVGAMVSELLGDEGYRSRVAPEKIRLEPETPPMPPVGEPSNRESAQPETPGPEPRGRALRSVAVDEDRSGVSVTVTDTAGTAATRAGGTTRVGRHTAIVAAVADLLGENPAPRIVEILERDAGVVLVVLEDREGVTRAGAAVIGSGFDFALGSAVWNAFSR
jgi:hypothetical protein